MDAENAKAYWRHNLRYITILLSIWFAVSGLAGILVCDWLDQFKIGGFPVGYWFANQGSMITFVILIVVYVRLMNALDRRFDVHEG